MKDGPAHENEETVDQLIESLHHYDRRAGVLLARLILTDLGDEGGSYRAFVRALTKHLRRWPGRLQTMQEDDLASMMRAAARELVKGTWDG